MCNNTSFLCAPEKIVPGFKDYFSRTWDQYWADGSECAWMKDKQNFYTLIKVSA